MEHQIDQRYRSRGMLVRAVLWLGGAGAFYFAGRGNSLDLYWAAATVVLVGGALVYEQRLKTSYHCPRCRRRLGPPGIAARNEIIFDCPDCDIVWHTQKFLPNLKKS